jgi:pimeloyl-ACP methyl ester carboxylesterase
MSVTRPLPTGDEACVLVEGPWRHREIAANGQRFHAVEAGEGPLVLLLHGFPQFWYAWRHVIPVLADAGFRVVAPDLRGYGASDKPPRGYDLATLSADVAGMIRALGEHDAMIAGHGWGGLLGWTTSVLHRQRVRRLATLGAAHPLTMRTAFFTHPQRQAATSWYAAGMQVPRAESYLKRHNAEPMIRLARSWAGPGWPDPENEQRMREAFQLPGVAHCSLEYYRWVFRSLPRPDGLRFARAMRPPLSAPVLALHGELDRCLLPETARASRRHVVGPYEFRTIPGVGHFLPEEAPDVVASALAEFGRPDLR